MTDRPGRGEFPFRLPLQHLALTAVFGVLGAGLSYTVLQSIPLTVLFVAVAVIAATFAAVTIQAETRRTYPAQPRATTCGTCGEPIAAKPDQIVIRGEAYCDDRCASFAW